MLPINILSEVLNYLELYDLLSLSCASKRYNKIANKPILYKQEFVRNWIRSYNPSSKSSNYWKPLCIKALRVQKYWKNLSDLSEGSESIYQIYFEVNETLCNPHQAYPELRRDILSFPTVVQDMLGNPHEIFNPKFLFSDDSISKLIEFVRHHQNGPKNLKILISLIKAIKKSIKVYCKGISLVLMEADDIIPVYNYYWNKYSRSLKQLNYLFKVITDAIAEHSASNCPNIFKINFLELIADLWRVEVFSKTHKPLIKAFNTSLISILHMNEMIHKGKNSINTNFDAEVHESKGLVESILDITLNKDSVHIKNHSNFPIQGPYKILHYKVLNKIQNFYSEFGLYYQDPRILYSIFPNITVLELNKIHCKITGKSTSYDTNSDLLIESKVRRLGLYKKDIFNTRPETNTGFVDILSQI
jgi:F-box-like